MTAALKPYDEKSRPALFPLTSAKSVALRLPFGQNELVIRINKIDWSSLSVLSSGCPLCGFLHALLVSRGLQFPSLQKNHVCENVVVREIGFGFETTFWCSLPRLGINTLHFYSVTSQFRTWRTQDLISSLVKTTTVGISHDCQYIVWFSCYHHYCDWT